jgi:2-polyprenyl-6-methoxyphenol hydroxylase-like FAD-dependent oxidoreductase
MIRSCQGVAIVGGGICGLALALNLHRRGVACEVYEAAPEIRPLGVGITMLAHAMRELSELGLADIVRDAGVELEKSAFFNRFGQLIYEEPRGQAAGYAQAEVTIHRGRLQLALLDAVRERIGADKVHTDHRCVGVAQEGGSVRIAFQSSATGAAREPVQAGLVVACDGVNSAIRRQFYPDETVAFTGINMWRGVTWRAPILDGRTQIRVGSLHTGKIAIYPIETSRDGSGRQLINWIAELSGWDTLVNDWNRPGRLEDFLPVFESWRFDWLDVPELLRGAEHVFEYPMVDKDPVEQWTFGRVTLAGDAAHPMYPRGSNGAAQSLIDARVLAEQLASERDGEAAMRGYETLRRPATAQVVCTNRETPPDYINIKVEELTGDRPFERLEDFISQEEIRAIAETYRAIAGIGQPSPAERPA